MEKKIEYTKKDLKKSYNNGIKDTIKTIVGTIAIGTIGYISFISTPIEPTHKEYQNAKWIESNEIPWNAYMKEKIPHNIFTWKQFQKEIKNRKSLEGRSIFPDLDHDKKVAQ